MNKSSWVTAAAEWPLNGWFSLLVGSHTLPVNGSILSFFMCHLLVIQPRAHSFLLEIVLTHEDSEQEPRHNSPGHTTSVRTHFLLVPRTQPWPIHTRHIPDDSLAQMNAGCLFSLLRALPSWPLPCTTLFCSPAHDLQCTAFLLYAELSQLQCSHMLDEAWVPEIPVHV